MHGSAYYDSKNELVKQSWRIFNLKSKKRKITRNNNNW